MNSNAVKKTVCVLASYAPSLINFRGELISALVDEGCDVYCLAPEVDEDIRAAISLRGAKVIEIPMQRTGLNPVRDLKLCWFLWRTFRQIQPDVLMAYTVKPVVYGAIAANFAGVKHIVALITGLGFTFSEQKGGGKSAVQFLIKRLYKFAMRCANTVVFQNPDDRALLVSQGLVRLRSTELVNGSGVNLEHFGRHPFPEGEVTRFLMIGRLNRDKGVREYVEAAKVLKKQGSDVECHLAGWIDSNPDSVTQQELDGWITEKLVIYHGHVKDVRPLLQACHVYVLPSYREGTPRTVLEAMATGRAVITTDAPGCRETVIDGENGYLVPVQDSANLARQMKAFVETPDLVERMGNASYIRVEQKYEVSRVNQTMLRYMHIIEGEALGEASF